MCHPASTARDLPIETEAGPPFLTKSIQTKTQLKRLVTAPSPGRETSPTQENALFHPSLVIVAHSGGKQTAAISPSTAGSPVYSDVARTIFRSVFLWYVHSFPYSRHHFASNSQRVCSSTAVGLRTRRLRCRRRAAGCVLSAWPSFEFWACDFCVLATPSSFLVSSWMADANGSV